MRRSLLLLAKPQILHNIPHKLVPAAGKLAKNALRTEPCGVPVVLGDTVNVDGADDKLRFGESELIQHKTSAGVKGFTYYHCGFYLQTVLICCLPSKTRKVDKQSTKNKPPKVEKSAAKIMQEWLYSAFSER